jgi:hypothetical protein
MRGKLAFTALLLAFAAGAALAQSDAQTETANVTPVPTDSDLYCSGTVTTEHVPRSSYVITGEESNYKITFEYGDYVYINRGANQGTKVGDEFFVVRPAVDPLVDVEWTKWQYAILHKMGTVWQDIGRLSVVVVNKNTSIAQVTHACTYLQRGDFIAPFAERTAPPLKPENNFDRFAPESGKPKAMVIQGKNFQQAMGTNDVMYVNLGSNQGVRVGDYFRVFRYTGTQHEVAYQTGRFAFEIEPQWGPTFGFGAASRKWDWKNTPRAVLGEGVVVRTSPNAAVVLLTFTLREVYPGDYVEIE